MANSVEQSCLPQFVLKMTRVLEWEVDEGGETHRKRHQSKNYYRVSQISSIQLVVLTCRLDSRRQRVKGREKNQPVNSKVGEVRMRRVPTLLIPTRKELRVSIRRRVQKADTPGKGWKSTFNLINSVSLRC